eukprot:TRINITY_DN196223_c0_g1_i1.p1 TRINITY_DN196223_c0_g1~~TRINITY_DN196223_c0_g1_i1.p1  ORF type:complete len:126 (+),score=11.85 TRINITY_DN196223_c0_g1_i1:61-438(+)
MSVGIPVKVLYEGMGHTVTVEVKTGEHFRGVLQNAEDNMNVLLESVTKSAKDGKTSQLEQVYIRGSQIRFLIFPDMLRHAPMFRSALKHKGRGMTATNQRRAQQMRARGVSAATRGRGVVPPMRG